MKIQRGDSVVVIAGDDIGPTPRRVIQVLYGGKKLLVEGVNRVYKHVRRGHPKSPQGGRLQLDMPIDSSNCMLYCSSCNRPTRVGFQFTADGAKERYCKRPSCGESLGTIGRPKPNRAS